ncbi:dihydrolipoamide acetyltransferase family protein [Robiginitomaculum antarcticum]|uniref:dihydrolipoamide acetyltransferase family protein n=1 Tax=Robiginitomaculum antarcticum TaxID=437507 RepID=UPI0003721E10|nr:dihydrolipoamide acetyltransferase family protein [Robiginitomaculum antarcticum]
MGQYLYKLPDIGEGVVEAEITAWHVAVGDTVEEEAPIADAMTDKATIELTSPVDGVIESIACEEGDLLPVGSVLVTIRTEGDVAEEVETADIEPEAPPPPEPQESADDNEPDSVAEDVTPLSTIVSAIGSASAVPKPDTPPVPRRSSDGPALASPAVRKRARALSIDLAALGGSGPNGRITHADLDAMLQSGHTRPAAPAAISTPAKPAPSAPPTSQTEDAQPGETRIKIIGLRRVIAQRMQEAKRNIPHFTYVEEIDVTELEAFRARANLKSGDDAPKLTVLPLLIKALSQTLLDWPQFNARYYDDAGYVSRYDALNLGIATQTDLGLIVPVVKDAGNLSMWDIAHDIARLAEAARTNTLSKSDLEGATTTLTSLGPLGGIVTTPVINRPEVAIFGPNKIRQVFVPDETGAPVLRKKMNFSVSCDHRVIDGYDAAKMVAELRARLEDPVTIFLE